MEKGHGEGERTHVFSLSLFPFIHVDSWAWFQRQEGCKFDVKHIEMNENEVIHFKYWIAFLVLQTEWMNEWRKANFSSSHFTNNTFNWIHNG